MTDRTTNLYQTIHILFNNKDSYPILKETYEYIIDTLLNYIKKYDSEHSKDIKCGILENNKITKITIGKTNISFDYICNDNKCIYSYYTDKNDSKNNMYDSLYNFLMSAKIYYESHDNILKHTPLLLKYKEELKLDSKSRSRSQNVETVGGSDHYIDKHNKKYNRRIFKKDNKKCVRYNNKIIELKRYKECIQKEKKAVKI